MAELPNLHVFCKQLWVRISPKAEHIVKKKEREAFRTYCRTHHGSNGQVHIITHSQVFTSPRGNKGYGAYSLNITENHETQCKQAKGVVPGSQRGTKVLQRGCLGGKLSPVQDYISHWTTPNFNNLRVQTTRNQWTLEASRTHTVESGTTQTRDFLTLLDKHPDTRESSKHSHFVSPTIQQHNTSSNPASLGPSTHSGEGTQPTGTQKRFKQNSGRRRRRDGTRIYWRGPMPTYQWPTSDAVSPL